MSDVISNQSAHEIPVPTPAYRENAHENQPGSPNRIRLRDARQLYLLVGECRATGVDGLAWRRLLTSRLRSWFEADLVAFIDKPAAVDSETKVGTTKPLSIVENGCLGRHPTFSPELLLRPHGELAHVWHSAQRWPNARVTSRQESEYGTRVREDSCYQRADQLARLGDYVIGVNPGSGGTTQLLCLFRQTGRPQFSRRVVHLLRALWLELRLLQPDELVGIENSAFIKYPKRMLQVLSCLLAGNTAKEAAALLDISIHTVQEHTKRLYKRTDTSNRAELAEFFHKVAPLLIETPLNEYPDYQPSQGGIIHDRRV